MVNIYFGEVIVIFEGFNFDFGVYLVRKGFFGFFNFLFEFFYSFVVFRDIDIGFFFVLFDEVINDLVVEVFVIKVSVISSS